MDPKPAVEVQIFGHPFTIRSEADQDYILSVAAYVDRKMREVTEKVPVATMGRVAVLASLNIADELFRERRRREAGEQAGAVRTAELERTLDQALGEDP
jgi:cell division protein ZapA